jgi:hypothetical protein
MQKRNQGKMPPLAEIESGELHIFGIGNHRAHIGPISPVTHLPGFSMVAVIPHRLASYFPRVCFYLVDLATGFAIVRWTDYKP